MRVIHEDSRKVVQSRVNAYGEAEPTVSYEAACQVVDSRLIKGMTEGRNAPSEDVELGRFGDGGGARRDPQFA